jgi:alcohol dehydrogenase (NADP+)
LFFFFFFFFFLLFFFFFFSPSSHFNMATIGDGKGTICLAAFDKKAQLQKHEFGRPEPGPNDVHIDIKYCGMCHSDCHSCNGDWGIESFPIAPGHEIAGIIDKVGANVSDLKVGDKVGVGCMVESCGECDLCKEGLEQHCPKMVQTYSTPWPADKGHAETKGHHTNGGYSSDITVNEKFVFKLPDNLELKYAGPLLCAGITTYSPLARHVLGKENTKVGVVGFGGLGHMAVKIAKAMGAEVTIFSRSLAKQEAAEKLGAKIVAHTDPEQLKPLARTLDVIIDTVSNVHNVRALLPALKVGCAIVLIGGVPAPFDTVAFDLIFSRHSIEGSLIGGVPETAEMLEFCAKHNIVPDIDVIHAKDADAAFQKLVSGGGAARRNVIDISTLSEL